MIREDALWTTPRMSRWHAQSPTLPATLAGIPTACGRRIDTRQAITKHVVDVDADDVCTVCMTGLRDDGSRS